MASYLDMVTVLMCMFIVMFAMSTVDQDKYEALLASLATGFGSEETEETDASQGVVVPEELLDEEGEGFVELDPEKTHSTEIQKVNGNIVYKGIVHAAQAALEAGIPVGLGTDSACPYVTH